MTQEDRDKLNEIKRNKFKNSESKSNRCECNIKIMRTEKEEKLFKECYEIVKRILSTN